MIASAAATARFTRGVVEARAGQDRLAASLASSGVSPTLVSPMAQVATLPPDTVSTTAAAAVA